MPPSSGHRVCPWELRATTGHRPSPHSGSILASSPRSPPSATRSRRPSSARPSRRCSRGTDVLGAGGDGHGQDRRVRAADAAARRRPRRSAPRPHDAARARADARARDAGRRGDPQVRGRRSGVSVAPDLRRRVDGPADPRAQARRRRRRGDARAGRSTTSAAHAEARRACAMVVLDEADEMLDMGFAEDLEAILAATPPERQTALFSATMPPRIAAIAERHLRNPARVTIAREKAAGGDDAARAAGRLHRRARRTSPRRSAACSTWSSPTSAIVFCRTRIEVDELAETLNAHGYRAEALHGGMVAGAARPRDGAVPRGEDRPARRDRRRRARPRHRAPVARRQLRRAVRARGLRAPDRPHRPRRARAGVAITLAEPREHRLLRNIEAFTKQKIEIGGRADRGRPARRRLERDARRAARALARGRPRRRTASSWSRWPRSSTSMDVAAAAVKMAHRATGEAPRET